MAADYAARARPDVSFEEVAALFSFPMAEASAALGVTTNDLKRICRENGVTRWPYRKILAGKSIDDIKREAAKEKALMEREAQALLHLDSHPAHLNKSRAFNFAVPAQREHITSDALRRQTAGPAHGYSMHSTSLRPLHIDHRSHLHNQFQLRANIPTYLDDFRHGFPSRGLPVSSTKWWGNSPTNKTEAIGPDRKDDIKHTSDGSNNGPIQSGNEPQLTDSRDDSLPEANKEQTITEESMPASILTRTRKNAVASGRKVVGLAVTRGYGTYHLADKDRALLKAIFADSLPSLWQAAMSD